MRAPAEQHAAMRWPQRLKRVFGIEVEICAPCGDTMRIIACIEDPLAIKAILAHLAGKARPVHSPQLPTGRAPPAPTAARDGNAAVTRRAVRDHRRSVARI
jgi:hypothetical protein